MIPLVLMAAIPLKMMCDFRSGYLRLRNGVYSFYGHRNSIIADSNTQRLYRIDKNATSFLKLILSGVPLNEFEFTNSNITFMKYLLRRGLADITESYIVADTLTEKTFLLSTVWLELRRACNLHCVHCYNSSEPCADDLKKILSLEDYEHLIIQLSEYDVKELILIGGEPLMYRQINELITFIHENMPNTQIVLYSNLTLLNEEHIKVLKGCNARVVTSIYSNNALGHEHITQGKGSYDKTVQAIKQLKSMGITVKANTVVMRDNESVMHDTYSFLTELTGIPPKMDTIRCVDDKLSYLIPIHNKRNHIMDSEKNLMKPTAEILTKNVFGNSCWTGKLNITYDGYATPCIMWNHSSKQSFNIKDTTLDTILKNDIEPNYWKLNRDRINVCSKCEYRYLCHDCRPLVQDLSTRGLTCLYNPYTGKWYHDNKILRQYLNAAKVPFQKGILEVAFVFSCPGQKEQAENRVCAGTTGKHLEQLISICHKSRPDIFKSDKRSDYTITNASDAVHYKHLTSDTEASRGEIQLPENLFRLESELSECKYIICMGLKASYAVSMMNVTGQIIRAVHLSNQSLNRLRVGNEKKCPSERISARLEYVAEMILMEI